MDFKFEQLGKIGIFTFNSDITTEHEDELKIILMRAIHGFDRAVLNFKKVSKIDLNCMQLLKRAYCTSVRLKNHLILTNFPRDYLPKLSVCNIKSDINYSLNTDWLSDSNKKVISVE